MSQVFSQPRSLTRSMSQTFSQPRSHTRPHIPVRAGTVDTNSSSRTEASTDGNIQHTYASYRCDSIPELDLNDPGFTAGPPNIKRWTLSVSIPIPNDLANPTLESLIYTIRYASLHAGYAFVQTDIVHSDDTKATEGIVTDLAKLTFYSHREGGKTTHGEGYESPTFNDSFGSHLGSVSAFKGADVSGWCYYVDHQQMYPDVRIGGKPNHDNPSVTNLYLFFHVYESGAEGLRTIEADVVARWKNGGEVGPSWRSERKISEIEEMRKERERLVTAKREAELTIMRIGERTRTAIEERESTKKEVLEMATAEYDRMKEMEGPRGLDETEVQRRLDRAARVAADSARALVIVEVEKFREEVSQYRQEEVEFRERIEAEHNSREQKSMRRAEADQLGRMEEFEKRIYEQFESYKREEADNKAKLEAKRYAREEERVQGLADEVKKLRDEVERYKGEVSRMVREGIENKQGECSVREEANGVVEGKAERNAVAIQDGPPWESDTDSTESDTDISYTEVPMTPPPRPAPRQLPVPPEPSSSPLSYDSRQTGTRSTSRHSEVPHPPQQQQNSRLPHIIEFDQENHPTLLNHSPHRVLYRSTTFPTATHLYEALKFIEHRPDLAGRIRGCPTTQEVYPLSADLQAFVRPDWGRVCLDKMEEVLWNKFRQHPSLRATLMDTGDAELVFADLDMYWGSGNVIGEERGVGSNQLGKILGKVRHRLRRETVLV